ncbi:MAG: hypothetical protein AAF810_10210 [Cyanobacteria bacterium P01_D01_bin.36]
MPKPGIPITSQAGIFSDFAPYLYSSPVKLLSPAFLIPILPKLLKKTQQMRRISTEIASFFVAPFPSVITPAATSDSFLVP